MVIKKLLVLCLFLQQNYGKKICVAIQVMSRSHITALSQRCFTQPGCFEENVLANVTTEFDCCMQGQLEVSFSSGGRCYLLHCLGECNGRDLKVKYITR